MFEYTFSLVDLEILILILVRISCFVFVAPFYSMSNVPAQAKIGLSAFTALLIAGTVDTTAVTYTGMI